jgi:hypothetical protein
MKHRITAHISPYLGGLAPETHHFVAELNKEAVRLKLPVRFTATANRILATGDLKRAANSATLSGWTLRRAIKNGYIDHERRRVWLKRAIRRQTDSEIEGEAPVLKRGNSQHRGKLRRYEKNRGVGAETLAPWLDRWRGRYLMAGLSPSAELAELSQLARLARSGEELLSPQEVLKGKVRVAAGTLYHLVTAIPQSERDALEIYPGDFRNYPGHRTVFIPQLLKTNWNADKLEWWRVLGWGRRKEKETFGIKDYSQPVRLLLNGRYLTVPRQKAALPPVDVLLVARAQDYGLDPHWDTVWRDCDIRLSLYALGRLKTPDEQRLLLRIGRFYKSTCWYSRKDSRSLFDKCAGSKARVQLDPKKEEVANYWRQKEGRPLPTGGEVVCRIPGVWPWHVAAKRYARLAATQESDNKKWVSYVNEVGLSKRLRDQRSLNIVTPLVRQTQSDDKCQTFTKTLIMTKPAERLSSPLRAELPKRRRTSSGLT